MKINPKIQSTLRQLPESPGVYRMLDEQQTVLYVGKARNLKKRVSQYFQKNQTHPKTRALIERITDIEVTLTHTETEALLLENNLIKRYLPKYNILLRDDKSYPYILIDTTHPYPSMQIVRSKSRPKKGKVFGPFPNTTAVHETLNLLQKCFQIRNCRPSTFNNRTRPCLQYQIKRCTAPCTGLISQSDYATSIKHAAAFLSGKSLKLIETLSEQMQAASKTLAYEEAARIRDMIKQLRYVQESQAVVHREQDIDIIVIAPEIPCIEHVQIRSGKLLETQAYFPKRPDVALEGEDELAFEALFEAFIRFYYLDYPERIPHTLLTQAALSEQRIKDYEETLKQLAKKQCHIQTKPRGIAKDWVALALNNLSQHISKHQNEAVQLKEKFEQLAHCLNLERTPKSIECFDISHSLGQATMASCVHFNISGPNKSAYRKFSIHGIQAGDDYAALRDAILRHLTKIKASEKNSLPDVLLIDGGKGQVHSAALILNQLQLDHIRLLGITKGEGRKARYDRIFDAQTQSFLPLSETNPVLQLLQQIRDEAHRFAINAHRKKRAKEQLQSTLTTIEGIGPVRRKKLIQYFGGWQALSQASLKSLMQVPGISPALAERIYGFFHAN